MISLDQKQDVVLILLDLSAAFDTIDHTILLKRLETRFGFGGIALKWIESFLCGRTQSVCIGGSMVSDAKTLEFGVPQGSILGPMLFSLYVTPLEDIIVNHGCRTVVYADDTQIYISCNSSTSVSVIESCVDQIRLWMSKNFLALNEAKTEIIRFSSRFKNSSQVSFDNVRIGDVNIPLSSVVKNLGVVFDDKATMSNQVANVCKSASYALWRLGKIRQYLDGKTTEKLVHAFVGSRLDYCNSLLVGIPSYQLHRLQVIMNSAARLVKRVNLRQQLHITPILQELHWLPISARIIFKIACLVFKCIHWDTAPIYLKDLINIKTHARNLRSSHSITLSHPAIKTLKNYGDRAFSTQAPILWNNLPSDLRCVSDFNTFKQRLKTYLFRLYYLS